MLWYSSLRYFPFWSKNSSSFMFWLAGGRGYQAKSRWEAKIGCTSLTLTGRDFQLTDRAPQEMGLSFLQSNQGWRQTEPWLSWSLWGNTWLWRQWLAGPWLSSKVSKSANSWCLKESTSFESSKGHSWRKIHLWRVYSTLRGDRSYCRYKQSQFTEVIIYSGSQVVRQKKRLITIKGMCL